MKLTRKERTFGIIITAIIALWTLTVLYPFIWTFINSFKGTTEIISQSWALPKYWRFENYSVLFRNSDFFIYFKNTIFITAVSIVFLILFSSMASYALACYKFWWTKWLMILFVIGIMIPQHASIIPLFLMLRDMAMLDKAWVLPIPYLSIQLPFSIYILTGFMRAIPKDFIEAATIDGCGPWRTYFSIILPISKPGITVVSIFGGVWFWNEFLYPMLLISSASERTLSVGIKLFIGERQVDFGSMLAGIILLIVPTLLFYFVLHKGIIKGMTAGALKE